MAGRLSFAASAEAGREFDKLATDLTTPRDSLTREVNLVVSLSRTPPLITSPSRSHLLPSYDRFSLSVYRFRERGSAAFNQPLLTKPSITRSLGQSPQVAGRLPSLTRVTPLRPPGTGRVQPHCGAGH